ncbi:unnamed protein product [Zymoseptoria tritici ST99CH_3D7]|uniref:tRNA-splicing endonuclease subunit Sen54 N-terminal domain-containing protein n=1 Tax=Zymoseptoria tritici (strain ST99CH_3D7) TaxID=1276538 RepID=A0A1X7S3I0_ZYMT9|nr:unnamed protein product [Zymoseptoria tritici ST99CH_3D7]
MADADEDTMPRGPSQGTEDIDLSDETQDFRFLTSISKSESSLPKRGEKDFEPHATALQSNTLAASRDAMHNALSYQRTHAPKGMTVGHYHPESGMAWTMNPKGPLFAKMGHVRSAKDDPLGGGVEERGQRMWLLPEEVLYLVERGTLDVRWPPAVEGEEELPMSLQGAYAMFIGDDEGGLTLERYSVYSGLKRMGYTVIRAPTWNSPGPPNGADCYPPLRQATWQTGLLNSASLWKMLFAWRSTPSPPPSPTDPIIQPGHSFRSYDAIYHRLALIPFYNPSLQTQPNPSNPEAVETTPPFRITYHIYKPGSTTYKKSSPGTPDFRIAVVNARESHPPTLQQLDALMETCPWDPPKEGANMYAKLRHGYKNVILAVVDQGVASFVRVADAAFGTERVFERRAKQSGGKRGGKGGRGGRGGRGRGGGR